MPVETMPAQSKPQCSVRCVLNGYWTIIHMMALRAIKRDQRIFFSDMMSAIINELPCQECRHHATMYINQDPIDPENGTPFYSFTWAWKFHNTVSERIGKEMMDWQSAYHIYTSKDRSEICTDCVLDGIGEEPVSARTEPQSPVPLIHRRRR